MRSVKSIMNCVSISYYKFGDLCWMADPHFSQPFQASHVGFVVDFWYCTTFIPSTSMSACQYLYTNDSYSFSSLTLTLYDLSNWQRS